MGSDGGAGDLIEKIVRPFTVVLRCHPGRLIEMSGMW